MKEKNPLDEYFKSGLEGHEIKPSASVWDKVEAGMESKSSGKAAGWYLMRAAMVTVLLGLSTWVFYQNNDFQIETEDPFSISYDSDKSNTEPKGTTTDKEKEVPKSKSSDKKDVAPKQPAKKDKVIPIMKQPVKRSIYVENTRPQPAVIDEGTLASDEDAWQLNDQVVLDVGEEQELTPIKMKFKVRPAATEAFYAENGQSKTEEKTGFKEKLYAYANTQFENLVQGRPLELPKAEKKPQIEIDLGRIFN